jgi:hypothetical protein
MFDFLTLSVVIDDRIFCVHGGESRLFEFRIGFVRAKTCADGRGGMIGLSPSIHSIDQIKVIDRFRGRSGLSPESIPAIADDHPSLSATQRSHTKVRWQISSGQIRIPIKKSSPSVHEERVTRSGRPSSRSFWRSTG